MRATLPLLAAALALAACTNNDQHDNTANVDENLAAENIVSNDVTAIDAVTGDAANMAAESPVNDIAPANIGNEGNMAAPTKPAAKRPRATAPAPSTVPPQTNSAAATPTNTAE